MINLADLKYRLTATLNVRHPVTNEPLGWEVTFAGPGHEKVVAYNARVSKETMARQAKNVHRQLTGQPVAVASQSVERMRRDNVESVVVRILGWAPVRLAADAPPVSFHETIATAMLLDPGWSWLLEQFFDFLDAPGSFLGPSAQPTEQGAPAAEA